MIALCFQERNKSRTSLLASELLSVSKGTEISLRTTGEIKSPQDREQVKVSNSICEKILQICHFILKQIILKCKRRNQEKEGI